VAEGELITHVLRGWIFQINTSDGGVPKRAVRQAEVTPLGLVGDRQRNLEVHGGPQRAVCLYALERILALQAEGHPIYPGAIGENLTLAGLDWDQVVPGGLLRLGQDVCIEITRYTSPCSNIAESFVNGDYSRVSQKLHPGWSRLYGRVIQGGVISVGEAVVWEGPGADKDGLPTFLG
jgi:MOSC domain-containing protein YiiM